MVFKLTCPTCDRYTSALFKAYENGENCPYCNGSLITAAQQYYRQLPHGNR